MKKNRQEKGRTGPGPVKVMQTLASNLQDKTGQQAKFKKIARNIKSDEAKTSIIPRGWPGTCRLYPYE